jgi:transcriptional regulator with XRE-family HTH domain
VPRPAKRPKETFDPKRAFGALLRELRQERGLSQEGFAHEMGYHRNYIGQLERGEKSPSLSALFNFAYGLGLRPSEMLSRIERAMPNR